MKLDMEFFKFQLNEKDLEEIDGSSSKYWPSVISFKDEIENNIIEKIRKD